MCLTTSGSSVLLAEHVENTIRRHVHADGTISALSIDFCGNYIPLQNEDEARLAACFLVSYHNSLLPHGPRLISDEKPPRDSAQIKREKEEVDEYGVPWNVVRVPRGRRANSPGPDVVRRHMPQEDSNCGESDSDDEKEKKRRLAWDFEQNEDIDDTPCFGKVGIVYW